MQTLKFCSYPLTWPKWISFFFMKVSSACFHHNDTSKVHNEMNFFSFRFLSTAHFRSTLQLCTQYIYSLLRKFTSGRLFILSIICLTWIAGRIVNVTSDSYVNFSMVRGSVECWLALPEVLSEFGTSKRELGLTIEKDYV